MQCAFQPEGEETLVPGTGPLSGSETLEQTYLFPSEHQKFIANGSSETSLNSELRLEVQCFVKNLL